MALPWIAMAYTLYLFFLLSPLDPRFSHTQCTPGGSKRGRGKGRHHLAAKRGGKTDATAPSPPQSHIKTSPHSHPTLKRPLQAHRRRRRPPPRRDYMAYLRSEGKQRERQGRGGGEPRERRPHPHSVRQRTPTQSHHVLGRPLPRRCIVACAVCAVQLRDLRHERVVRIGVRQEGANGEEDLGGGCWECCAAGGKCFFFFLNRGGLLYSILQGFCVCSPGCGVV